MDFLPDYLWFLLAGTMAAVISAQMGFGKASNFVALTGLALSVGLLVYGVYLFTKEPEPCGGGMKALEGTTLEEMECVLRLHETPVIPK